MTIQARGVTLGSGLDARTVVMSREEGPVGIHLINNHRLVASQHASGKMPSMSAAKAEAIVVLDLKSGREISRIPFTERITSKASACSPDGRFIG